MAVTYTDPYGPPWKLRWWRMVRQWRGSIWQVLWLEWLMLILLGALSITLTWALFPDFVLNAASLPLMDVTQHLYTRFQAAIGLMLGFYTSTMFSRWQDVRQTEGKVIGVVLNTSLQVSSLISAAHAVRESFWASEDVRGTHEFSQTSLDEIKPDTKPPAALSENDVAAVQFTLIRWINLAHALGCGLLYEKRASFLANLNQLVDRGLLTHAEKHILEAAPPALANAKYALPLTWYSSLVKELSLDPRFGVTAMDVQSLNENPSRMRSAIAHQVAIKNTPVPLMYRQLVQATVRSYCTILVILAGFSSSVVENRESLGLDKIKQSSAFPACGRTLPGVYRDRGGRARQIQAIYNGPGWRDTGAESTHFTIIVALLTALRTALWTIHPSKRDS
ncbi:hypothetical protein FVE85_7864 [Porphyridium purpureum]|uniref:Uncharacterized protein n=1 Tax=Porphyridium purpureum TaxID=35688 RepID=A0A5J4YPM0_PORPP|nr:hypothetical protein FVE85_7864 [Porphyridium purpureum]|eukprot:POR9328..scf295_9